MIFFKNTNVSPYHCPTVAGDCLVFRVLFLSNYAYVVVAEPEPGVNTGSNRSTHQHQRQREIALGRTTSRGIRNPIVTIRTLP